MEYRIHQLSRVSPIGQPSSLEEDIEQNLSRFQQVFHNYPGKPVMHVFIKNETEVVYRIFASLHLNGNDILVKEEGTDILSVVRTMLDRLYNLVKKQLLFERKDYLEKRKNRMSKMADSFLPQMLDHIAQKDEAAFINLAGEVLPEAFYYVRRSLKQRLFQGVSESEVLLSSKNITQEVYKELYTLMQTERISSGHILTRILSIAENLLTKLGKEQPGIYVNDYAMKKNYKAESIFTGVNTKPVLEEDLDEKYFAPGEYNLAEILYDAGISESFINQSSFANSKRNICELTEAIPFEQKSVFELYYLDRFTSSEIASIMQVSEDDIEKKIEDGRLQMVNALTLQQPLAL